MRTRTKLFASLFIAIVIGAVLLGFYAVFVKAQAQSLLNDLTALKVGGSTESDLDQLTVRHRRYFVSREFSDQGYAITTFKLDNRWLSLLRLEPYAWFGASITVESGHVRHISAWLMRSMDIFPTFGASAGMVDEYVEFPEYYSRGGHYQFPTPVGKPYLNVQLDSQASPIQRQHAFAFSFHCLIKPGGGCDLPCDYLPSAWQDWKHELQESGFSEMFNNYYPKNSRCKL